MTDRVPAAAAVVIRAVWSTLSSSRWALATEDIHERVWLISEAVCDSLYQAGVPRVPSGLQLQRALNRQRRDDEIIAAFTGRNYDDLARLHGVSSRTVRRIIERHRGAGSQA